MKQSDLAVVLAAHRIVPSALAGPQMRAIVAEVVAAGWDWGALADFARRHYGLEDDGPCCNDRSLGFCCMYHQAPDPNAAAFTSWLPESERAIAACAWYRASFAWVVAMSRQHLIDLREKTSINFALDETGAIVAPDDYRPEDALRVGARHDGIVIGRVAVQRAPRAYMDAPEWYPSRFSAKGAQRGKEYRRADFLGPVTAWIEGVRA